MSINSSAICSCSFVLIIISSEWQNSENKSFLCNICSQLIFLRFAWFRCQSCAVHFQDASRNNDYFGAIYVTSRLSWHIHVFWLIIQSNEEVSSQFGFTVCLHEWGWGYADHLKIHLATSNTLTIQYTDQSIHWPSKNTLGNL